MTLSDETFDVAIVGGGPAGLAAGAQASRRGLAHIVLERGELANTVFRYQKGKLVMAEPARLALHAELPLRFEEGSREEVLDTWREGIQAAGVNLALGPEFEVTGLEGLKGSFQLTLKNSSRINCRHVVFAIGVQGNPRKFGVPGDDHPHVSYQLDDAGEFNDQKIVVVGVGDAGIENALALSEQNRVSIVNRRDEFPRAKPANRALIDQAIASGKIRHYTDARVVGIDADSLRLETPNGEVRVESDLVIGRLGAVPPRAFLDALKISFSTQDVAAAPVISDHYESSVPGLYLIGAVAGYPLIKNCMNQGFEVIEHILGKAVTPADEPLLREVLGGLEGDVESLLQEVQAKLRIFGGITRVQLREFLVDSKVHMPGAGEIVFRINDYSDSVYSVLRGSADVVGPGSDASRDSDRKSDAPGDELKFRLTEGECFGEMSLVSGRRRSSTIIAGDGCVLIETPRSSMIRLMNSVPEVKRAIDEIFISRKLQSTLAPTAPLRDLEGLASAAVIETYRQGETLFKEGDLGDGMHLIRRGSVTVWRWKGGERQVLAYLPAGNLIGEMAFFSPDAKRSATIQATVLTETIRLPVDALLEFHRLHPDVRRAQKKTANERLIENAVRASDRSAGDIVEFLMSAGTGEATDILLIDESLCIHCDNCEKACAETHGGVSRLDRQAGPTFATLHIPTSCRHCENPKCMIDCPPDALRRKPSGEVYIMDNCIGCGNCAVNCPYDVIQMAAVDPRPRPNALMQLLFGGRQTSVDEGEKKLAVKCDLCLGLPRGSGNAGGKRSACVESCPTGAVLRVDPAVYVHEIMEDSNRG